MDLSDLLLFRKWLYAPHVARWYHEPLDWIAEVEDTNGEFGWIRHFIAEQDGVPVGFCQYYDVGNSGETFGRYSLSNGTYSIDYLIGSAELLHRGIGKQIVGGLTDMIVLLPDAKRIVAQPEPENAASRALLSSCGFAYEAEGDVFIKEL